MRLLRPFRYLVACVKSQILVSRSQYVPDNRKSHTSSWAHTIVISAWVWPYLYNWACSCALYSVPALQGTTESDGYQDLPSLSLCFFEILSANGEPPQRAPWTTRILKRRLPVPDDFSCVMLYALFWFPPEKENLVLVLLATMKGDPRSSCVAFPAAHARIP